MSKTYKFRNKDNSDSKYLKHYFSASSFRGKFEEMDDIEKRYYFKRKYGLIGGEHAPKWYKRDMNRAKKRQDKQNLNAALRKGELDDLATPVWKKDADYDYF